MTIFDPLSSVICKGCKGMINFDDPYLNTFVNPIRFPKGDLSLYEVLCTNCREYYEYLPSEVLVPVRKEADLAKQVKSLREDLTLVNSRLEKLENGEWIEARWKELEKRLAELLKADAKPKAEKPVVAYG